ncbi:MAG: glycerophosphodiester phosphodiesterase [Clostridia bacterium]|nr:glycerophosphodiester phosphodiesterase [Clostridia bacterium]
MLTLVILLAVLAALYLFLIAPSLKKRDLGPLEGFDYAHRGLWDDERPENSLPAFRAAVAQGFGIETDVHITADDQLIVFHDDSLKRMCGVDRKIADCTLEELRRLSLKDTKETIPTFDEFLTAVGGAVPLIVEIKTDQRIALLCEKVNERLEAYDGPYCVESFDPRAVRWYRKHRPDVIRGQLTFGLVSPSKTPKTLLTRLLASQIQNVLGRPDFIAAEAITDHSLPMRLLRMFPAHWAAWTVRSQAQMDQLRGRYELQIFEKFVPRQV